LSADGTELFFQRCQRNSSIADASGNATMDIWKTCGFGFRMALGSSAELLPEPINSATNDKSPFLHPDGRTLYFASDQESPGGGGYDLWMCQRDSAGSLGRRQKL